MLVCECVGTVQRGEKKGEKGGKDIVSGASIENVVEKEEEEGERGGGGGECMENRRAVKVF